MLWGKVMVGFDVAEVLDGDTTALSAAAENVAAGLRGAQLAPVWVFLLAIAIELPVFAILYWFAQFAAALPQNFDPMRAVLLAIAGAGLTVAGLIGFGCYAYRHMSKLIPAVVSRAIAVAVLWGAVQPTSVLVDPVTLFWGGVLSIVPLRAIWASCLGWAITAGLMQRRAVIAGGGEHAVRLINGLAARGENDIRLYGIFDDRDDIRAPLQSLGVPKLGDYRALLAFIRASEIDMVIIALPLDAKDRIEWLLNMFKVLPVDVRLSTFNQGYNFPSGKRGLISALDRSFAPQRRLRKRAFDMLIACLALIALSPVMVVTALAIKLETKGPILFRQKRHGYNHRVVDVLKFRSMHHESSDPDARNVVRRGDPRVTRVGRFIRRTSIDELPQLFNVLRGDLSLVGPRPHAVNAVSSRQEKFTRIVDGYAARHRLPPGITGWAQVNGWRGEIDEPMKLRQRFEHDLFYIENWSLWFDLKILIATPMSLVKTDAAY